MPMATPQDKGKHHPKEEPDAESDRQEADVPAPGFQGSGHCREFPGFGMHVDGSSLSPSQNRQPQQRFHLLGPMIRFNDPLKWNHAEDRRHLSSPCWRIVFLIAVVFGSSLAIALNRRWFLRFCNVWRYAYTRAQPLQIAITHRLPANKQNSRNLLLLADRAPFAGLYGR
jgi:hypothetical protein